MSGAKEKCRLCGGDVATGKLQAGNADARIAIAGKADGFLGVTPWTASTVRARVCRACGHIELYARDLQDLLAVE